MKLEAKQTAKADTNLEPQSIREVLVRKKSLLTAAELAELLSFTTTTIYEGVKAGRIPSIRLLNSIRFDPKAISEWLDRGTTT